MTNNQKATDPEYMETLVDALDHIARVCRGSRTQTRRIRWIEARARIALEGGEDWRDVEIPKHDPTIEALRSMIAAIYPFVLESAAVLRALVDGEQLEAAGLVAAVAEDLEILERFVADVRRNCHWIARERDQTKTDQREAETA